MNSIVSKQMENILYYIWIKLTAIIKILVTIPLTTTLLTQTLGCFSDILVAAKISHLAENSMYF